MVLRLIFVKIADALSVECHQVWNRELLVEVFAEEQELIGELEVLLEFVVAAWSARQQVKQPFLTFADHAFPEDVEREQEEEEKEEDLGVQRLEAFFDRGDRLRNTIKYLHVQLERIGILHILNEFDLLLTRKEPTVGVHHAANHEVDQYRVLDVPERFLLQVVFEYRFTRELHN